MFYKHQHNCHICIQTFSFSLIECKRRSKAPTLRNKQYNRLRISPRYKTSTGHNPLRRRSPNATLRPGAAGTAAAASSAHPSGRRTWTQQPWQRQHRDMRTSPAAERARRAHRRYGTRQDVPGMGTFLGTTLLRPGAAHQTQGLPRQSQGTSQPQCWQRCRSPGCARRSGARPVPPVPHSPSPRATGKAGGQCCATSQVKRGAEGPSPIHKPLLSLHCCCFPRPCGFFSKSNSNFSSQQRGRLNAQERPSRTRSPGPGVVAAATVQRWLWHSQPDQTLTRTEHNNPCHSRSLPSFPAAVSKAKYKRKTNLILFFLIWQKAVFSPHLMLEIANLLLELDPQMSTWMLKLVFAKA